MKLKRIDLDRLQEDLTDALKRARHGERIILHRRGRAVAALVPVEDANFMERYEGEFWGQLTVKDLEEMERTGEKPIPFEFIERQVDSIKAREARESRGKRRKLA